MKKLEAPGWRVRIVLGFNILTPIWHILRIFTCARSCHYVDSDIIDITLTAENVADFIKLAVLKNSKRARE
jgi:hypothetical protein